MNFKRLSSCESVQEWRTKRSAKHTALACAQLLLAPLAQTADIPLDRAIDQAIAIAQVDELAAAVEREAQGYRRAAAALPNPSLFYERETLNASGPAADSRETAFGLAAPLDFIWKRAARVEVAALRGELALLQIEDQRRQIAKEVAALFAQHEANRLEYSRHGAVHVALDRAKAVAKASVETGDAPPSLLQRVELAIARHAFEENRLQSDRLAIQSRFAALLGDREASPGAASLEDLRVGFPSESSAKDAALQNRPDLKAAQALVDWKRAEQKAARREGLPELSLEAAHKEDNIGRDGVYLGLSVELPIFDRNQGATSIAAAEALRAEVAYRQAQRAVESEAASAYLRWEALRSNWQRLAETLDVTRNAEALLAATEASFEAGESSLFEYLDTVEAYLEAAEHAIALQRDLRLAAIELASVTATQLHTK